MLAPFLNLLLPLLFLAAFGFILTSVIFFILFRTQRSVQFRKKSLLFLLTGIGCIVILIFIIIAANVLDWTKAYSN